MTQIRLLTDQELLDSIPIAINAYPYFAPTDRTPEEFSRIHQRLLDERARSPIAYTYGCFRDDILRGTMKLFDYTMNVRGIKMLTGGLGGVAVGMLHKKKHVAKEMVEFFLRHYRARSAPIAILYPFRPDFYHKMGFGYGPIARTYRFRTHAIPRIPHPNVRFATDEDQEAIKGCYQRYTDTTHGMIDRPDFYWERVFASKKGETIVHEVDGEIRGYLRFVFERSPDNHEFANDLVAREFVYETADALSQILSFVAHQFDQAPYFALASQDEDLHHLLADPRNNQQVFFSLGYQQTHTAGIGLMYRVIDVAALFKELREHNFNDQTSVLQVKVDDDFLPENAGSTVLTFQGGRVQVTPNAVPDATLSLHIREFSALIMGSAKLSNLIRYGLAHLDHANHAPTIQRIFDVERPPICLTAF
jgi:predicted acetyltransferase